MVLEILELQTRRSTHNIRFVVDAAKTYPNSFVVCPWWRHKELSIIPHGADMIAQLMILSNVIVAGGHRHRNRFMHLNTKFWREKHRTQITRQNNNEKRGHSATKIPTLLKSCRYHFSRIPSVGAVWFDFTKFHSPSKLLISLVSDSRGYKRPVVRVSFVLNIIKPKMKLRTHCLRRIFLFWFRLCIQKKNRTEMVVKCLKYKLN